MKKLLIMFAMVIGIIIAAHAQQMVLTVTPYADKDTTAKVQGIDKAHFIVYFGKEVGDNVKDPRYFLVLRRSNFDSKTLELYSGTGGSPLTKVTDASFALNPEDYENTIVTSSSAGTVSYIRRMQTGYWIKPDKSKVSLERIPVSL